MPVPAVLPVGLTDEFATDSSRKAAAAKYRNPASGETWNGRGRPLHWLADEVAKGKKREDFWLVSPCRNAGVRRFGFARCRSRRWRDGVCWRGMG